MGVSSHLSLLRFNNMVGLFFLTATIATLTCVMSLVSVA